MRRLAGGWVGGGRWAAVLLGAGQRQRRRRGARREPPLTARPRTAGAPTRRALPARASVGGCGCGGRAGMRGRGAAHLLLGERGEALGLRRALRGPLRHLAQCWQSHERIINLRRPFAAGQFDSYYGLERVVKQKFFRKNSPGEKTRRSKNSLVINRETNFLSITPAPSSFRLRQSDIQ